MNEKAVLGGRFRRFVIGMDALLQDPKPEQETVEGCAALLKALVDQDDWLPEKYAQPHPEFYQQYLLYCDPGARYSVVSFVWGPGQKTPVHDHGVWGVIGMLRGAETSRMYWPQAGRLEPAGREERLEPGDIALVSPTLGDIHQVCNAYDDRVSISIHVYGTDIGKQSRHVFDPATGAAKSFVSGYANEMAG